VVIRCGTTSLPSHPGRAARGPWCLVSLLCGHGDPFVEVAAAVTWTAQVQPDKAGALGRKCVPGLKERAPCCTAADFRHPARTRLHHGSAGALRIENQGSRGNGPCNASPPSVHIPATTHRLLSPTKERNERNRDDQPDQSSRWCGPAVGRRPNSAVTESAWFGHPAAAALAGGPWDRRWRLA
jgi:hypothetical protein